ncbi:hypothetical protein RFI_26378 [Reticulomyxa filosa]|uniref:Sugar phosphate transporter domain-containing protein n=1 Tax=Reticulomyxa filosa TaxID=46433 RepID=X6MAG9_RETFI|nr:hypothetical protein RFI_26378 [Reticulomyxa filosa]|eukprot:ETO10998.1 hypothetical protein RFI_26378 [Reticulomyxa filosa]
MQQRSINKSRGHDSSGVPKLSDIFEPRDDDEPVPLLSSSHDKKHEASFSEEKELQPHVIVNQSSKYPNEAKLSSSEIEAAHSSKRLVWSPRALLSVTLFLVLGPTLIMMNKYILHTLAFEYPILLASLGMFFSGVIVHVLAYFNKIVIRNEIREVMTWKFFLYRIRFFFFFFKLSHPRAFKRNIFFFIQKKIVILGLFQALTLTFGNRVYVYLSVSLIQMLKSFTPVMVMTTLFLFGMDKPTWKMVLSIILLSAGTAVTCTGVSIADSSFIGFTYIVITKINARSQSHHQQRTKYCQYCYN